MAGLVDLHVARVVARAARSLGPMGRHWGQGPFALDGVEPPWRTFCVLGALGPAPAEGPIALWRAACLLDRLARDARIGPPAGGGLDEALLGTSAGADLGCLRWTDATTIRGGDVRRFLRRAARVAEGRFVGASTCGLLSPR